MVADEICTYLAAAGLGLVYGGAGANLFDLPFGPGSPDAAVCVHAYSGARSERTFGPSLAAPASEHPFFHVLVRGTRSDPAAALALADSIYKKLDGLGPVQLSGVTYRDVRSADGPPKFLEFDGNQRPIYFIDFHVDKDRS